MKHGINVAKKGLNKIFFPKKSNFLIVFFKNINISSFFEKKKNFFEVTWSCYIFYETP